MMVSNFIARMRSLWLGVRDRSAVETQMQDEFRLHIELRAADLVCSGLSHADALRRARQEFGSTERYKEEGRASRGLRRIDEFRFSLLDFKLGLRMLARYPGLTVVGGLAMAFAIWLGACTFELINQWTRPNLALDDGDRIVGLQLWDAASSQPNHRAQHDFLTWRKELKSVQELSAFRSLDRNLITTGRVGEPVEVAEITASAFGVTGVPAHLGRVLIESDERPGTPPVMVISYDLWQEHFGGDRAVIGRTIQLGSVQTTVVGVMPKSFAFPINQEVWTPLRLEPLAHKPAQGPAIRVFGRLADGKTLDEAQVELNHLGRRAAAEFPDTHKHLRPQVLPYARSIVSLSPGDVAGLRWMNLGVVLLVVLVCANVALLLFARAATRESEVVVRSALGASRGRIIMQLFAEALVLGALGTVVGLAAAGFGLRWALFIINENLGDLPYWVNAQLSRSTLLYALGLTILGAIIAGVVPALRVTRAMSTRLREASAGGGGLGFGGFWTVVIVAQVAVTVTFPVASLMIWRQGAPIRSFDVGFAENEYLSVRLELDAENAAGAPADTSRAAYLTRFRRTYEELERRLSSEPAVAGVTFASQLPRTFHPAHQIDLVEDLQVPGDSMLGQQVKAASVDIDYLDVLGAPILAGRHFHAGDVDSDQRVVIVNQSFVEEVLRGRNPIGRRVRLAGTERSPEPGPWYQIVGVVRDLGMHHLDDGSNAGFYQPLAAAADQVYMIVKVRGDPASFAPRLRAVTQAVDPTLRLYELRPMNELRADLMRFVAILMQSALLMSVVALLLSLAGIYAVMSFAVSRRTREIGIRVALGADARRVLLTVFRRPLLQIALGIGVGGLLVTAVVRGAVGELSAREIALICAHATVMTAVCMLACIVPTRRALNVQPTEALRADA